jgi:hypothetical protein
MAIWFERGNLVSMLIDIASFKAGIVINEEDLTRLMKDSPEAEELFSECEMLRLESVVVEDMVAHLLWRLGNIPTPERTFPVFDLAREYQHISGGRELALQIAHDFSEFAHDWMKKRPGVPINPTAYLEDCQKHYNAIGLKIAIRFLELANLHLHVSPWGNIRTVA